MIRLLRGRVAVREIVRGEYPGEIWMPSRDAYEVKTHRGVVIAKGEPAIVHGKHEVPHGFEVGDVVQYHFTHLEKGWTVPWPEDGEPVTYVPQENVDAVIE